MGKWFPAGWPSPACQAAQFVILAAILGVLALVVGESLPRRWFHYDSAFFRSHAWEKDGAIYEEKLKIRKWKDHMPDNSKIFPFLFRKKVVNFHDPDYSKRLLQETCVAEAVHWALIALSPLFLVLMEPFYNVVAFLLYICPGNLPFIAIQRYNRPRLAAIYERQLRWQREEAH